jgi:orotidine-5'-phosphate decarboxylase
VSEPRIIVALDFPDLARATQIASRLDPVQCRLKVGKELFVRGGPTLVSRLINLGFDIFLDLKFHDIPNTVGRACRAAAELGVWMLNVHALGGRRMLEEARSALDAVTRPPLLVAVTLLTSLTAQDLAEVGLDDGVEDHLKQLVRLAMECNLDGVVCAPTDLELARKTSSPPFILVTPGIRPRGMAQDDQRRVSTPAEALCHGADYLVIGRPITSASEPLQALRSIENEIQARGA